MKILNALASIGFLSFSLVGCFNYTATPLCNEQNAVVPEGLSGTYSFSYQDQDFNVVSEEMTIAEDGKSVGQIQIVSSDEVTTAGVCSINGKLIVESQDEKLGLYSQNRLYITSMGLTTLPVMYDRASLEQAGIPSKVIEVPLEEGENAFASIAKSFVQSAMYKVAEVTGATVPGFVVGNDNLQPNEVAKHMHTFGAGITFLRK